jgi:hypothetical protein
MKAINSPWSDLCAPSDPLQTYVEWVVPGGDTWQTVADLPLTFSWEQAPPQLALRPAHGTFLNLRRYALKKRAASGPSTQGASSFTGRPVIERQILSLLAQHLSMHPESAVQVLRTPHEIVVAEPLNLGSLADLEPPRDLWSSTRQRHIVSFLSAICSQLAPLHAQGIAHQNITAKSIDIRDGQMRLSAFTALNQARADRTGMTYIWGAAAPELCAGWPTTSILAADVWQLAVCVLNWLKLWPADGWRDPAQALRMLESERENTLPPSSHMCNTMPNEFDRFTFFWYKVNEFTPDLRNLLHAMLRKDPNERPTLQEVMQRLRPLEHKFRSGSLAWKDLVHHSPSHRTAAERLLQANTPATVRRSAVSIAQHHAPVAGSKVQVKIPRLSNGVSALLLGVGIGVGIIGAGLILYFTMPLAPISFGSILDLVTLGCCYGALIGGTAWMLLQMLESRFNSKILPLTH